MAVGRGWRLWRLPADVEDEFDQAWPTWIDDAARWEPFFAELERCGTDIAAELQRLDLASGDDLDRLSRLKRTAEQRAVAIGGSFTGSSDDLTMLALGFARGELCNPAVPFQPWSEGDERG